MCYGRSFQARAQRWRTCGRRMSSEYVAQRGTVTVQTSDQVCCLCWRSGRWARRDMMVPLCTNSGGLACTACTAHAVWWAASDNPLVRATAEIACTAWRNTTTGHGWYKSCRYRSLADWTGPTMTSLVASTGRCTPDRQTCTSVLSAFSCSLLVRSSTATACNTYVMLSCNETDSVVWPTPPRHLGVVCVQMTAYRLCFWISGTRSAVHSNGLRTEPCGMPNAMLSHGDRDPECTMHCWHPVTYKLIRLVLHHWCCSTHTDDAAVCAVVNRLKRG